MEAVGTVHGKTDHLERDETGAVFCQLIIGSCFHAWKNLIGDDNRFVSCQFQIEKVACPSSPDILPKSVIRN